MRQHGEHAAGDAIVSAREALTGPRVAGIDPGSHWIAVTVLARTVAGLVYVASLVIEVGRVEPLAKPRTVTRADGSTYTITRKRIITDEHIRDALAEVVCFLAAHGVERVAVEMATHMHAGDGAAPNVRAARAAQLLRAQWVGGEIAGALRAGLVPSVTEVERASSATWRAFVRKLAKTKAWKAAVRLLVAGLPDPMNEHALDAAGLAARIVRAPTVKREKRASGEGGPRKRVLTEEAKARHREVAREGWRAKAAAERARRIAAGCIGCARKHVRACPMFVSKADRAAAASPQA